MNRIYQGRVSKVEIPGDKENPWQPLPNWQDIRWQHHELFQDAVIPFSASDGEKVAAAG